MKTEGLYCYGIYAGTKRGKDTIVKDTGEVRSKFFLGVKVAKPDGFEGEMEFIEIRLTNDQLKSGWLNRLDNCKGEQVGIPFRISTFAPEAGKIYESLFLEHNRPVIGFDDTLEKVAAQQSAKTDKATSKSNGKSAPLEGLDG